MNRVYIVHRGTEFRQVIDTAENKQLEPRSEKSRDNGWRHRLPDPELEIEMLSRLMIYLGLQKAQATQQVENIKLLQPRAFMQHDSEQNSPYLIIKDAYHLAWNRVYHHLERLNFEIESANFERGLGISREGSFVVKVFFEDSSSNGGLFSRAEAGTQEREIALIVSEEGNEFTRVDIENARGEYDSSPEGREFLALLYEHIK